MVTGRLELTVKINELPVATPAEKGIQTFEVDCEGRIIEVAVKQKVWNKLEQANTDYPMWVAAITGKMGQITGDRITLEQPNIQVFEKKPKEAVAAG